jgi:hypothetical protein
MSHTITVRITDDLARWLRDTARRIGVPKSRIVREHLELARDRDREEQRFMRLAGAIRGPGDLSTRKGFSSS